MSFPKEQLVAVCEQLKQIAPGLLKSVEDNGYHIYCVDNKFAHTVGNGKNSELFDLVFGYSDMFTRQTRIEVIVFVMHFIKNGVLPPYKFHRTINDKEVMIDLVSYTVEENVAFIDKTSRIGLIVYDTHGLPNYAGIKLLGLCETEEADNELWQTLGSPSALPDYNERILPAKTNPH